MQEKMNEIIDRVNNLDPSGSSDYVKTVNGYKGDVKLTGNDIPYNQLKSVNKQVSDNASEIQTVKQNIADLDLSHVLAGSSAQIQLMQQNSFNSITDSQWKAFYDSGFRVVGIVNVGYTEIQALYLQSTKAPHKPIQLKDGGGTGTIKIHQIYSATDTATNYLPDETNEYAYIARIAPEETAIDKGTDIILYINKTTPSLICSYRLKGQQGWKGDTIYTSNNPPPYPVTSVNGKTGAVTIPTGGAALNFKTVSVTTDQVGRYNTNIQSTSFIAAIPIFTDSLSSYTMNPTSVDGKIVLHVFNIGSDPIDVIRNTTFDCLFITKQ